MAQLQGGSLYDINKNLIASKEKALKGNKLMDKINEIVIPYLKEMVERGNAYFMMLCHERRDYTVFSLCSNSIDFDTFTKEIKLCMTNRGEVFAINRTEDDYALEFWIKDNEDKELSCYFLFPYDDGVIEI